MINRTDPVIDKGTIFPSHSDTFLKISYGLIEKSHILGFDKKYFEQIKNQPSFIHGG